MNVLLVGGTGVLSSAVVGEAQKKGLAVTMINRGHRNIPAYVEHIKADKNDLTRLSSALDGRKFDAVIDFLCYTKEEAEKSILFYSKYTDQYIFISSCAVYDTISIHGGIADESSPKITSIWQYSVDKWACEEAIISIAHQCNVNYTIIRPAITYDDTRIPYGIAPHYGYHWTLCARILAGKPLIRWDGGLNHCNMMRVEDFAVGAVGLIGNPSAYNEAFNICGDEAPSWNDVLKVLGGVLGKDVLTVDIPSSYYATCIPSRYGEIIGGRAIDSFNNNQKIKRIVPDFKQIISLREGIAQTVSAYKALNFQSGIDWRFDADTDRIIKKWCRENHISTRHFNLRFIDYLGSASFKDRLIYLATFHKDFPLIKLLKKIRNV